MTPVDLSSIGDVRIKLNPIPERPAISAMAEFRIGPLMVTGIRITRHADGRDTVRWPDYPRQAKCDGCLRRIGIMHQFCSYCGAVQPKRLAPKHSKSGAPRLFKDMIHPADAECRLALDRLILGAYEAECRKMAPPALFVPRVVA